ncbi:ATP-binding cassette domain-containing protein [Kitasatospora sp. NPDC101235]|uniref:ATP-binding cassette domain-containing protein n=1 Tax=Kitasatospora sp. NPDC101235 TaxID=3364101 RepID=UPI00381CA41A
MLGPNGVGKSTLVKVLLGILPAAVGEVRVLGAAPGERNAAVGYLPQRRNFDASVRIRAWGGCGAAGPGRGFVGDPRPGPGPGEAPGRARTRRAGPGVGGSRRAAGPGCEGCPASAASWSSRAMQRAAVVNRPCARASGAGDFWENSTSMAPHTREPATSGAAATAPTNGKVRASRG